jgi:hypothetical protein
MSILKLHLVAICKNAFRCKSLSSLCGKEIGKDMQEISKYSQGDENERRQDVLIVIAGQDLSMVY